MMILVFICLLESSAGTGLLATRSANVEAKTFMANNSSKLFTVKFMIKVELEAYIHSNKDIDPEATQ